MTQEVPPVVTFPAPPPGTIEGPTGPAGPPGPSGQPRWSGYGPPPSVIPGAAPNDVYLDLNNGDTYILN